MQSQPYLQKQIRRAITMGAALAITLTTFTPGAFSQAPPPPPPSYPPQELDRLVSRVALYPDPLLSQIFAAATFPDQIPEAARWADQHHYLTGDALARGHFRRSSAVGSQRAIFAPVSFRARYDGVRHGLDQRTRQCLPGPATGSDGCRAARAPPGPTIMDICEPIRRSSSIPAHTFRFCPRIPRYIVVPYYDPLIVFAPPRPGFFIGGAIGFRFGVTIGPAFAPWGWGVNRFAWNEHRVFINNAPWGRTWANRGAYVHPYAVPRYSGPRPAERHELQGRSERERQA